MGKSVKEIAFLSAEEIIFFNRRFISTYGGFYVPSNENVQNPNSLNFLVEAVHSEIFGTELYPSIYVKAAAYMFYIINDHIFFDGNKRTGTQAAISFLEVNGFPLNDNIGSDEVERIAMDVATSNMTLKELSEWFERNTSP